MLEILDETEGQVLAVRVSGKYLQEDAHELVSLLDARIANSGAVRCLVEISDFAGVELGAVREELSFDVQHAKHIERCAIVGDRDWERWLSRLSALIFRHAEVRFFEAGQRDAAVGWIRAEA